MKVRRSVFVGPGDENSRPICPRCSKPISGETKEFSKGIYHKECFVCGGCGKPLNDRCISVKNSPNCSACGRAQLNKKYDIGSIKVIGFGPHPSLKNGGLASNAAYSIPFSSLSSSAGRVDPIEFSEQSLIEILRLKHSGPPRRKPTITKKMKTDDRANIKIRSDPRASSQTFVNIAEGYKQMDKSTPPAPTPTLAPAPAPAPAPPSTPTSAPSSSSPPSPNPTIETSVAPRKLSMKQASLLKFQNMISASSSPSPITSRSSLKYVSSDQSLSEPSSSPPWNPKRLTVSAFSSCASLFTKSQDAQIYLDLFKNPEIPENEAERMVHHDQISQQIHEWRSKRQELFSQLDPLLSLPFTEAIDFSLPPEKVEIMLLDQQQKKDESFRKSAVGIQWMCEINQEQANRMEEIERLRLKREESIQEQCNREIEVVQQRLLILDQMHDDQEESIYYNPQTILSPNEKIEEEIVFSYVWEDFMKDRLEGYLLKQSSSRRLFKKWKPRWFSLKNEHLVYYKQKQSKIFASENPPDGIISITSADRIMSLDLSNPNNSVFHIVAKERSYVLKAESSGDMDVWISSLVEAKQFFKYKPDLVNSSIRLTKSDEQISGYMERMGRLKWSKKWFIIKGGTVYRYKTEGGNLEGQFSLYNALLSEYQPHKYPSSFQISSSREKESLVLRASSLEEMHEWLNAIQKQKLVIEETVNSISF